MRCRIGLRGLVRDVGADTAVPFPYGCYGKYGRTRQCRFPTDILGECAIELHVLFDRIWPDTAMPFPYGYIMQMCGQTSHIIE
ncbi:hypothetical protein QUB68_06670 [Microcoleus sp. A006_D1]|uniref:hypothetical protein n=1 Tax=Microcoleus sp. A006_D1 TaxID=3055267 RepID=UPI002FD15D57